MNVTSKEFTQSTRVITTKDEKGNVVEKVYVEEKETHTTVKFKMGLWSRLYFLITGQFYLVQKSTTYVPVNFYFEYPESQKSD